MPVGKPSCHYAGYTSNAGFEFQPFAAKLLILAQNTLADSLSITQLQTTARTLPGMVHATAQPDLHPGTRIPIGAVFVSRDWIHLPLIGAGIGCGMA